MMTPNSLREAYADLGQLVNGHDPVRNKTLGKRYPEGLNALTAAHLGEIVQGRVLRPIDRCRPWLDAKVEATAVEDIHVHDITAPVSDLTEAIADLPNATNDRRDALVQTIDEALHDLHRLLGHFV
jgi:hypothetical protein